jgi:MprA protease rhombosortase-interaction domain-containing protein
MKALVFPIFGRTLATIGSVAIGISSLTSPATARTILESDFPNSDFSNLRSTPTSLGILDPGVNSVRFVIANPNPIDLGRLNRDLDYFTLRIPAGFVFSNLVITEYEPQLTGGIIGTDQISFISIQRGTVFTQPPQPSDPATGQLGVQTDVSQLLGYTLIGSNSAAAGLPTGVVNAPFTDFLTAMGATGADRPPLPGQSSPSPSPAGFDAPLSAGEYVFWVQQTASGSATLGLNFVVSPIPEPTSALAILAIGGVGFCVRRRGK